jgi:hypothetical protein
MRRLAGAHVPGQQPLQRGQVDRLRRVVVEPAFAPAFAVVSTHVSSRYGGIPHRAPRQNG